MDGVKGHLCIDSPCDMEGKSTAWLVTGHAGSVGGLCFHPSFLTDVTRLQREACDIQQSTLRGGPNGGPTQGHTLAPVMLATSQLGFHAILSHAEAALSVEIQFSTVT